MIDDAAFGDRPVAPPRLLPPPPPPPPPMAPPVAGAVWALLPRLPPPPAPSAPPHRRRWPWVVGAALGVLLLVAVATAVVVRRNRHSYPDAWDPALAALVPFVEHAKGAEFKHPVRAVFLTDEEFDERAAPDESSMTDEDRQDLADYEATLRALGLNGGAGSVLDQQTTVGTDGVAAYYDPSTKEIVIPADDRTSLLTQESLVHELTHALQDQLGQLDDEPSDTDTDDAFRALVEGDAQHVTTAWYDSLDEDQQGQLDDETAATGGSDDTDHDTSGSDETSSDDTGLEGVSPAMSTGFGFPYAVGEPMVDVLDEANQLDGAFDDPPRSTADVLDPDRWLHHIDVVPVDDPALADGEDAVGPSDTLGALNLYFMLATVLDPADALDVAGGWGGDRMQPYRDGDGVLCVRAALTGVDDAATDAIEDGASRWATSRPDGTARSSRTDAVITVDACDPGDGAPAPLTMDVAALPLVRAQIVFGWTDGGGYSFEQASCIADALIDAIPPEVFALDEPTTAQQDEVDEAVASAESTCG